MTPSAFHALSRNSPRAGFHVDFLPHGAECFAGPCCGQDDEIERSGWHTLTRADCGQESRQIGIGHGRMMLYLRDLGFLGQRVAPWPAIAKMFAISLLTRCSKSPTLRRRA